MLNKKEKAVMKAIYYKATESNGVCLMRPIDILTHISTKVDVRSEELEDIVNSLQLDGYYDLVNSKKNNETVWCFSLEQKGYAFYREIMNEKRWVTFKIAFSISLAVAVFLLKLIMDAIAGR